MIHWLGSMLVISVLVLLYKERVHYIQFMQDGEEDFVNCLIHLVIVQFS